MFRKFITGLIALTLVAQSCIPARAWVHGAPVGGKNPFAKSVLNLGSDKTTQTFINAIKACSVNSNGTPSDFFKFDLTGYLTAAPVANMAWSCAGFLFPSTTYRFRVSSFRKIPFTVNSTGWGPCTKISGAGSSTCSTGGAQGGQFTIQSGGTGFGIDDVFEITTPSGAPTLSAFFPTTGTYAAGSGEIALYRASDETAYLAGTVGTPEYIAEVRGAGPPAACRFMGMTNTNTSGEVKWAYRIQPTNFGWGGAQYPPTIVNPAAGGLLSGTNTYTGLAATDTPGSITAGEMYIAVIQNANTGTPTLNIGGRGAVQILNDLGSVPAANELKAGQIYTFWYDEVLLAYVVNTDQFGIQGTGGILSGIPIEGQIGLSNAINCDLYTNLPTWADATYTANTSAAVKASLNSWLNVFFEKANETWNQAFFHYYWMLARGVALGFPTTGFAPRPSYSYYGLAVKQMANAVSPAWSGSLSRLNIVMGNPTIPAFGFAVYAYRMEGTDLVPGNTAYNSFTGSANYSVSPNRPVDVSTVHSEAPYVGGTNLRCGPDVDTFCTGLTTANAPFYQAVINAIESGNMATAVALVDDDVRGGLNAIQTVTASGTTFTTPLAHGYTAGTSLVSFTVAGGTSYSNLATYSPTNRSAVYQVSSTPTSSTFTVQGFTASVASGANINPGTPGTGTLSVGNTTSGRSMLNAVTTMLQYIQSVSDRYNGGAGGSRPAGFGPLMSLAYEANLEPLGAQNVGNCTAMGVTYSNPTTINFTANTNSNNFLNGIASTAGIIPGMTVTGTDIPANTVVTTVQTASINISQSASGTHTGTSQVATSNCVTESAQAIASWYADPAAAQTEWDYQKQFMGTYQGAANFGLMTSSQGSAQLVNMGGGTYAFLPSLSLTSPIVPRQTYNGFRFFNTN